MGPEKPAKNPAEWPKLTERSLERVQKGSAEYLGVPTCREVCGERSNLPVRKRQDGSHIRYRSCRVGMIEVMIVLVVLAVGFLCESSGLVRFGNVDLRLLP